MEKNMSWIDFWSSENCFTEIMKQNIKFFLKASRQLLNYSKDDVVLDIGCGPGHFSSLMKDEVKEIHGVDVSENYVRMCRQKYRGENLFFYQLDRKDYTNFSLLKGKKFSLLIAMSVIQYYKSIDEIKKLIEEVKKIAMPCARFLIADIPINDRELLDSVNLLKTAFKEGFFFEALKSLVFARISSYHLIRSSAGLLILSQENLEDMIEKLGIDAELLDMPLTILGKNRRHLLIRF